MTLVQFFQGPLFFFFFFLTSKVDIKFVGPMNTGDCFQFLHVARARNIILEMLNISKISHSVIFETFECKSKKFQKLTCN